jgi:hypothetical protein
VSNLEIVLKNVKNKKNHTGSSLAVVHGFFSQERFAQVIHVCIARL